jgi:hypothetical protein
MANFYANVAHAISEFDACLDLVTEVAAADEPEGLRYRAG